MFCSLSFTAIAQTKLINQVDELTNDENGYSGIYDIDGNILLISINKDDITLTLRDTKLKELEKIKLPNSRKFNLSKDLFIINSGEIILLLETKSNTKILKYSTSLKLINTIVIDGKAEIYEFADNNIIIRSDSEIGLYDKNLSLVKSSKLEKSEYALRYQCVTDDKMIFLDKSMGKKDIQITTIDIPDMIVKKVASKLDYNYLVYNVEGYDDYLSFGVRRQIGLKNELKIINLDYNTGQKYTNNIENKDYLNVSAYQDKKGYILGIEVNAFENGKLSNNNYSFLKFDNFFGFYTDKKLNKDVSKIEEEKDIAKKVPNLRIEIDKIGYKNGNNIYILYAFTPIKKKNLTMDILTVASALTVESGTGHNIDTAANDKILGYRYSHANIFAIDDSGNLLWNRSFKYKDIVKDNPVENSPCEITLDNNFINVRYAGEDNVRYSHFIDYEGDLIQSFTNNIEGRNPQKDLKTECIYINKDNFIRSGYYSKTKKSFVDIYSDKYHDIKKPITSNSVSSSKNSTSNSNYTDKKTQIDKLLKEDLITEEEHAKMLERLKPKNENSIESKLKKVKEYFDRGIIDEEEYQKIRSRILLKLE